jgi:hypothetical protein
VHFKKEKDLFAYHALPIVMKGRPGKEISATVRKDIRARWEALSMDERAKWTNVYLDLLKGDLSMLKRVTGKQYVENAP